MGNEGSLAINRSDTRICERGNHFPGVGGFLVQGTRTVENMVDCLGVGDPQAFFLHSNINVSVPRRRAAENKCTPSDPFQRAMVPYSSRIVLSTTPNSSCCHHHV